LWQGEQISSFGKSAISSKIIPTERCVIPSLPRSLPGSDTLATYPKPCPAWIAYNQFGRRNLTLYQRAELALALEELIREEAATQRADRNEDGSPKLSVLPNSDKPNNYKKHQEPGR
jgi:hypothetical protein